MTVVAGTTFERLRRPGFTLVELMVVVAILSIVATLAIAAFNGYVRRSKIAEATGNLNQLFKSASAYYVTERTGQGLTTSTLGACTVPSESRNPDNPGLTKQRYTPGTSAQAIGFSIADYVYFGYGLISGGSHCGWLANTGGVYTLFANGDVDGDDIESTFELAVGSDDTNTLYHARGFLIVNETE
jgi:prepilin-type N-terminal cleavage/methylation domain-containing protein